MIIIIVLLELFVLYDRIARGRRDADRQDGRGFLLNLKTELGDDGS